jgi:hypothetical protein
MAQKLIGDQFAILLYRGRGASKPQLKHVHNVPLGHGHAFSRHISLAENLRCHSSRKVAMGGGGGGYGRHNPSNLKGMFLHIFVLFLTCLNGRLWPKKSRQTRPFNLDTRRHHHKTPILIATRRIRAGQIGVRMGYHLDFQISSQEQRYNLATIPTINGSIRAARQYDRC